MKRILLSLAIWVVCNSFLLAQTYVMEWQSPEGWEIEEQFVDGLVTPKAMTMNTDVNNDGIQDFVIRDYNNDIIEVYNMFDYSLLWSYQIPVIPDTDWKRFRGFADITNENTKEMILLYENEDPERNSYKLVIVNTSTNEHTIISEDILWDVVVWHNNDIRSKLIFQVGEHIEIWGDGSQSSTNNNVTQSLIKLNQNFPNPFNPSTTINYELMKSGFINLKIYNIKGQLVKTLVNKEMNTGKHSVVWNAKGFISGQYFYQISIDGKVVQTKKSICIK